jgi:hypothetical protein
MVNYTLTTATSNPTLYGKVGMKRGKMDADIKEIELKDVKEERTKT